MNRIQRHHLNIVVWAGLWGLCGLSHALGLGPLNSRVTMGEGLALTVPVRLEPGEHLGDDCVSADVYFGDDKLSAIQVDVNLMQGSQGPYAILVRTTSAVNEPVVTVQVAAGCLARVARKYVVMADPPGLSAVSAAALAPGGVMAQGQATAPGQSAHGRHGPSGEHRKPRSQRAWPVGDASALSMRWTAPAVTQAPAVRPEPVATERLVLSGMRMATTLDLPSAADDNSPELQARRSSAAAHWWALQATPGQLALEQARLQDLERRVAELQDWRPPAPDASLPASQAAAETASDAASSDPVPQRASPNLSVDPDEVMHIRIVGLLCVAMIGLTAWGFQHWRRRTEMASAAVGSASEQAFAVPPSWLAGRR